MRITLSFDVLIWNWRNRVISYVETELEIGTVDHSLIKVSSAKDSTARKERSSQLVRPCRYLTLSNLIAHTAYFYWIQVRFLPYFS